VLARVLDPYIEQTFLDALAGGGPLAEAARGNGLVEDAARRVEAAQAELDAYRDTTAVAIVGARSFEQGLDRRARVLDEATRELAAARRHSAVLPTDMTPGGLVEAWPTLSVAERRQLLAAAIDAVVVKPVRGSGRAVPVSERAVVLWRGTAPADLPRRGLRVPLVPFNWPDERPDDLGMAST
jgi:hypothetical protein